MEFDDSAQLDTSQISDQRSGGMFSSVPGGGLAVGGGGLGIVGVLIFLLVSALGGGGGGGDGSGLGGILNGSGTGAVAADNSELRKECRTGADANRNDTCANVGVVNSVQRFWTQYFGQQGQRYAPAKTVFFRGVTRTGCGQATAAVGDDRIQQEFQGRVTPESWTHGSSAQRQKWFTAGYRGGTVDSCDTFSGSI